ncbi:MAG: hypothetical protein LBT45_00005, partial [Rickettsiales bacterium]|nr:hypothetical protein [Rickettsiales bacterium]
MRKIILIFGIMAIFMSGAPAAKLCQLDWLTAWKNKSGTLSNSGYAWTRNTYTEGGAGGGTWAVTSDEGSSGVKH